MKMKATAIKEEEIQMLEEKLTKLEINYDDVIRMRFLEQSAKYFGVYVENSPNSLLDEYSIN